VLRLLHLKNSSLIFGAFQIISGLVYRGHVTAAIARAECDGRMFERGQKGWRQPLRHHR
jgi:hypothetical protein